MDGQQVRVLVVDDDALTRKAVRLTCESEGYTVQEAERASVTRVAPELRDDITRALGMT